MTAIASASTTYVIGAKVDVVIEFTTGTTNGIDWTEAGALLEICADKDTFGSNLDSMGWGDPPGATDNCYDL